MLERPCREERWSSTWCVTDKIGFTLPTNSNGIVVSPDRVPRTCTSFVITINTICSRTLQLTSTRREDLEDLLVDPLYFQAIFHSLDRVKALYLSQAELGAANEAIASKIHTLQPTAAALHIFCRKQPSFARRALQAPVRNPSRFRRSQSSRSTMESRRERARRGLPGSYSRASSKSTAEVHSP